MYAINRNNQLFIDAMGNLAKSANASGNRFSWGDIKPYLKSLENHSRAQKVMALAWKLYRSSPMAGGAFDPLRFALYMRTAHAEVDHEDDAPITMTREEILFIGSDCATKPNGGRP
ncbi:hypothetical protein [uncultured Bartonella sp.]|uniref:hypothetical protein n=1 Tax=uncultured Bartonella sp. TaxID=104108 RepID=UPI0025DF9AB4|nr:hypothetical protein [uncultured Bartonella sp.]